MSSDRKKRAGGRASRIILRTSEAGTINPSPPGQISGAYKPLSENDLNKILKTAYRLLEEIGIGDVPDELAKKAVSKGAKFNKNRLYFSELFVKKIITNACKEFTLFGRSPEFDITVGGNRSYFGTGGAAVQTKDIETGEYRASTLKDVYDFSRLIDRLENVSWFTRCCIATEIESVFDVELNTAYAMLKGTKKPIGISFTQPEFVKPIVEMYDIALGGVGEFSKKPFCKAHISPIISPMRYGEDAFDVALACMEYGMPINAIIAAQSGATAPATLAGMLAQSTAETLAGLIMINVFEPGYPVIFSNWPFVIDLRTGAFSGSGGETSVMNAAAAQIGNFLGLPTGVASSMSDAKTVDAQMGSEKTLSATATGLAGANMIYESAGMMASLLGVSFEAFVADNEMLSTIQRLMRGIEVNQETLGFKTIKSTVFGPGHYLGGEHTISAMQRDYYYPRIGDRKTPAVWEEEGKMTMEESALKQAKLILKTNIPNYLDVKADEIIRKKYNILLNC